MSTTVTSTSVIDFSWDSQKNLEVAVNKDINSLKVQNSISESTTRRVYRGRTTVSPGSTTADLDLTNLTDPHNDSINFSTIEEVYIINRSETSGDDVVVGGAGAGNNAWGHPFDGDQDAKVTLTPSSDWALRHPVDPLTVDASNKVLRIAHDTGTNHIDVDVYIRGTI